MSVREAQTDPRLLCRVPELDATGCREFRLGNGEWSLRCFVVRAADGSVHAYVNRCAHQRYPLNYDQDRFLTPDGSAIVCYVHLAMFERDTGTCFSGPCSGLTLARVPVRVVDGQVLLAEGVDPEEFAARYA
jgi:nitrite reductase/ring-hydroxylating ferredoxin subunit